MLTEVKRTIVDRAMLAPREPVWVAVSGGVDSMVLLHVLRSLGHECSVVHVDHGLRGAESDGDRHLVEEHCHALGIRIHVEQVNVEGHAALKHLSTQMAARELRYEVFARALGGDGPKKLAMAHHADDALETLLMNLMRGTGIAGWATIPPISGPFIRPLIGIGRNEVMAYAREHGVAYREDSSNADTHYLRNRVRHELLPMIDALRPGAHQVMLREVEQLRSMTGVVDRTFQALRGSVDAGAHSVPFKAIEASGAPVLFLQWLLTGKGFHPQVIDAMYGSAKAGRTGSRFLSSSHVITVEREGLHIVPRSDQAWPEVRIKEDLMIDPHAGIAASYCSGESIDPAQRGAVWLDADRLSFPLLLRTWQDGDRMRPSGLGGSKLISDILTDAKVPSAGRQLHRVLVSGTEIICLLGQRTAEGYVAGPGTGRVLKLEDFG